MKKHRNRKHRSKREKIGILTLIFINLLFFFTSVKSFAAESAWYINNMEILSQNNWGISVIRRIGWGLIKIAVWICDAAETLYDKAFGFIDFTADSEINAFIEKYQAWVIALMALSFAYLGVILILKHEKKPDIMVNICIVILCVTMSAKMFMGLNEWVNKARNEIYASDTSTGAAYQIINDHIADLVYLNYQCDGLDKLNWKENKIYGAGINKDNIDSIKFDEVLNPKSSKYDWRGKTAEFLGNQLVIFPCHDPSGNIGYVCTTFGVDNGWGWNSDDDADIGNEFYYRYHFDFLPAILHILALSIIFLTMSYKVLRVIFELIVARLLGYLYSAEVSGGEKIRKIAVFIRDSYILLVITAVCIKVYLLMAKMLNDKLSDQPLVAAIFSLFLAFCVIDGPNLVEKLLGMDAGLKSSTARMIAIGRVASGTVRGIKNASPVKNAANRINSIKSGKASEGGLAGLAVGTIFGKEQSKNDPGTERVGGLLNKGKKEKDSNNSSSEKSESGSSEGGDSSSKASEGGSAAGASSGEENGSSGNNANVSGSSKDFMDKGKDGKDGKDGKAGKDGQKGSAGENGKDSNEKSSAADKMNNNHTGQSNTSSHSFMDRSSSSAGNNTSSLRRTSETNSRFTGSKKGDKE